MRYGDGDGVNVAKQWCGRKIPLEKEAALAMFIDSGGVMIGVAGRMALFAELVEGVPAGFGRLHQFMRITTPQEVRQECTLRALRACAARCHVLSSRLCTIPALRTLPRRKSRACVMVERSGVFAFGPSSARSMRFMRGASSRRGRIEKYLRVDGILGIPAVALEHSHSSSTVHIREVHKLSDRSLLLLCVCWRHLLLACVSSLLMLLSGRGRGSEYASWVGTTSDIRYGERRSFGKQDVVGVRAKRSSSCC